MKIVRVCEYMLPQLGGASTNEIYVSKELVRRGHDVTLLTSDIAPGRYLLELRQKVCEEFIEGVRVIRSKALANLGGDMPIMPTLPMQMWNATADIIHAHEYYNYTSIAASFVAKKQGIPFSFTQERYYPIRRKAWRIPFRLLEASICKPVIKSSKGATAFTTDAKRFLVSKGYPAEKIEVIPMGVDIERFRPSKSEWLQHLVGIDKELVVLSVARLHYSKRLGKFIQAMKYVKSELGNVKGVIMGRGPDEHYLKSLIRSLKLDDTIFLVTEHVNHDQMVEAYNSCDVFLLLSHYEPFGMALLEAMACGKPVIVSDTGGLHDVVRDGVDGLKVQLNRSEDSVQNVAEAMMKLLTDERLRGRSGEAARKRMETAYDWKHIAKRYEQFYEELLGQR